VLTKKYDCLYISVNICWVDMWFEFYLLFRSHMCYYEMLQYYNRNRISYSQIFLVFGCGVCLGYFCVTNVLLVWNFLVIFQRLCAIFSATNCLVLCGQWLFEKVWFSTSLSQIIFEQSGLFVSKYIFISYMYVIYAFQLCLKLILYSL
jgi:hypothetical protein